MTDNSAVEKAKLLNDAGLEMVGKGEFDGALAAFTEAMEVFRTEGFEREHADQLQNIGSVYRDTNKASEALDYYGRSLDIYKNLKFKPGIANQYSNIAYIYFTIEKYEEAVDYFTKAELLYQVTGDEEKLAMARQNILVISEKFL